MYRPPLNQPFQQQQFAQQDDERGKKSLVRRTVDHSAGLMRYLEDCSNYDRPLQRRIFSSLEPTPDHIVNVCLHHLALSILS